MNSIDADMATIWQFPLRTVRSKVMGVGLLAWYRSQSSRREAFNPRPNYHVIIIKWEQLVAEGPFMSYEKKVCDFKSHKNFFSSNFVISKVTNRLQMTLNHNKCCLISLLLVWSWTRSLVIILKWFLFRRNSLVLKSFYLAFYSNEVNLWRKNFSSSCCSL